MFCSVVVYKFPHLELQEKNSPHMRSIFNKMSLSSNCSPLRSLRSSLIHILPILSVAFAKASVSVGLLTKEQLEKKFRSSASLIGPACIIQAQIHGRDLTYPLSPAVPAAFAHTLKHIHERFSHKNINRVWSSKSTASRYQRISKGRLHLGCSYKLGMPMRRHVR